MESFRVVRVQWTEKPYAASGQPHKTPEVVGVIEEFSDLSEAIKYRTKLLELCEMLRVLGVSFSAQYAMEIEQMKTGVGLGGIGGVRRRLLNLEKVEAEGLNDDFWGGSVEELIRKTRRDGRTRELEGDTSVGETEHMGGDSQDR